MFTKLHSIVSASFVAVLLLGSSPSKVLAYTADNPKVQGLVKKAVAYLESPEADHTETGGKAIIAMALMKAADANHPKVQRAVKACRQLAEQARTKGLSHHSYSESIACMFLCDLDAQKYKADIQALMNGLLAVQRPNGAWAYVPYTGFDDTSQTQYGVLALWACHTHNIQVPSQAVVKALNWYIATQHPRNGGWSYRAKQGQPTETMAAAGLGSLYISAYLLGLGERGKQEASNATVALREVKKEQRPKFLSPEGANLAALKSSVERGQGWLSRNFDYDFPRWNYYFMYGIERYKSFEEIVEGTNEAEPDWYNRGVDYLANSQAENGSWKSPEPGPATAPVDTAFAVLFLTRGTKKSIKSLEEGQLRGGKMLPSDLTQITLAPSGQVVDTKETPPIETLLAELESDDSAEIDPSIPIKLELSDDPTVKAAQVARLRRMAMSGKYQARLVAVKTLGKDRDLDNVPVLIYALSDPDSRVVRAARDGLRFISRRLNGFGLADNPETQEWKTAQAKWKDWYLSLVPDGTLIE